MCDNTKRERLLNDVTRRSWQRNEVPVSQRDRIIHQIHDIALRENVSFRRIAALARGEERAAAAGNGE